MKSLEAIQEWPCTAAAAVIRPDGVVVPFGDTARPFALASVTKLFTAAATLLAVEEGSVRLDDPIDPRGATLADLLGHAAGLAPDGAELEGPGRRRIYSNGGYERAAAHVETHTEMAFSTYLREGVFQPLSMSNTDLTGSPAFGAHSTVDDLVSFLLGLPALLAPETVLAMTSPYLPELVGVLPGYGRQAPNTWGLGPEIRSSKSPHWTGTANSAETWGHFGQAGTFVWFDPTVATSLIVLTDRPFGDWALERWSALSDSVLDEAAG